MGTAGTLRSPRPRRYNATDGGVAERLKAAVLKIAGAQAPVGSNPTPSDPAAGARYLRAAATAGAPDGSRSTLPTAELTTKTRWLLLAGSVGTTKNPGRSGA